jgi:hypothetical protein
MKKSKVAYKTQLLEKVRKQMETEAGIELSLNQVIIACCEQYLNSIHLSPKQMEQLTRAGLAAKRSPSQMLTAACEWAQKFYTTKYQDTGTEYHAGSAYKRIDQFVKKQMRKNDLAKRMEDKVYINQTYLSKHQGSNRDAIKGYLELNGEMLLEHHRRHKLRARHNNEVSSILRRD